MSLNLANSKKRWLQFAGVVSLVLILPMVISNAVSASQSGLPVTPPITSPITPPVSPTPTATPIEVPTPTATATATPTATATATPTATPVPTPIPDFVPVVSTATLPIGHVGKLYKGLISVYDLNINDHVAINTFGLPNWMSNVSCTISYANNRKTYNCTYFGTPNKTGVYTLRVNANDQMGGIVNKLLKLTITL